MRLRLPSRISIRLLLFNILLVFFPVAGFLYLGVYEQQLLEDQERSMVQQGRLLAAALGEQGELSRAGCGVAAAAPRSAHRGAPADLRAGCGRWPRPPRRLQPAGPSGGARLEDSRSTAKARDNLLYKVAAGLYRLYRRVRAPLPQPTRWPAPPPEPYPAAVVRTALTGKYGATVRPTGGERLRPSVTLHSAIPVRSHGAVVGAVLVSQSTVRILRELDQVRLDVLKVFFGSVVVAAILSLLLAGTITHPIRRLRDEANELLDRRGRLRRRFGGTHRADEIGDLTRALEQLTARLAAHQHTLEAFASDVSHELKNPLASIRSATELLAEIDDPRDRERFVALGPARGRPHGAPAHRLAGDRRDRRPPGDRGTDRRGSERLAARSGRGIPPARR